MTNVKIPRSKPRKHNKLTVVFGATIATILLLILIKVLISRDDLPGSSDNSLFGRRKSTDTRSKAGQTKESPFKPLKELGLTDAQIARVYQKLKPEDEARKHLVEQAKLLAEFKKKIHLELPFPVTYDYLDLDLDDNVAAILGTSNNAKKHIAVLATARDVTVTEALNFLKENTQAFDFISNHKFIPEKAFMVRVPETSGLKNLHVVPSTDHQGNRLYVALSPRADGKGTYLFMMEAPKYEFIQNEDGLGKMLELIKANP